VSYVWAAYGVTFIVLLVYGGHLARERRELVRRERK
jgi:heme exporter protein CcmD